MDDAERVHLVERGFLDVFAVELAGDRPVGRRQFVTRVAAGEMALGADRVADPARPAAGLRAASQCPVSIRSSSTASAPASPPESSIMAAVTWIDTWIAGLSGFAVRGCPPPRDAVQVEAEPGVSHRSGCLLTAQHGDVVWVSATAAMRLLGRTDLLVPAGEPPLPLTERTWSPDRRRRRRHGRLYAHRAAVGTALARARALCLPHPGGCDSGRCGSRRLVGIAAARCQRGDARLGVGLARRAGQRAARSAQRSGGRPDRR